MTRLWRALPAEGQRQWADTFSARVFQQRMGRFLEQAWQAHEARLRRGQVAPPHSVPLG